MTHVLTGLLVEVVSVEFKDGGANIGVGELQVIILQVLEVLEGDAIDLIGWLALLGLLWTLGRGGNLALSTISSW